MIASSNPSVLFVSIGRSMNSLRYAIQRFSHDTLYIIHTNTEDSQDSRMVDDLKENQRLIRITYPNAKFIEVSVYNFHYNVGVFRSYFQKYKNIQINCDITGGDKIVSLAMVYARLLEFENTNIGLYYQRRNEDIEHEIQRFIQIPNLPCLTKKQVEFMEILENTKTLQELSEVLDTSPNNIWNYVDQLSEYELVRSNKKDKIVTSKLPFNYYSVKNEITQSDILPIIRSYFDLLSPEEKKDIINLLKDE